MAIKKIGKINNSKILNKRDLCFWVNINEKYKKHGTIKAPPAKDNLSQIRGTIPSLIIPACQLAKTQNDNDKAKRKNA